MSARDEISKAAENAMADLAGTSEPSDDGHVPEPGKPGEPIKVNSSVSEATNATEDEREGGSAGGPSPDRTSTPAQEGSSQTPPEGKDAGDGDPSPGAEGASAEAAGSHVPGPGGLPERDPQDGASEVLESDEDPSVGMGRG
ncbi:hypothetical protein GCM10027405_17680 [Arthrobacter alkaliphilus]|uniref:hypothetical protein n=1 Tax=Arthrobacter alkaliphilus TaxID=369936 RepID=UPI001F437DE9|nr:hypothetical protein [Arthrobacter alkaliphilus]